MENEDELLGKYVKLQNAQRSALLAVSAMLDYNGPLAQELRSKQKALAKAHKLIPEFGDRHPEIVKLQRE